MSGENNNLNNIDGKINNDKGRNTTLTKKKDKESPKSLNVIFYCDTCKRVPLIIFSEKNPKILKYCEKSKNIKILRKR